jgi:integrase
MTVPSRVSDRVDLPDTLREMPVCAAGEIWLESRKLNRSSKTIECNRGYLKHLAKFFGDRRLKDVHVGLLRQYQAERSRVAGPSAINHELNALAQILAMAELWDPIGRQYRVLPEPKWVAPKTFTVEEEQTIFMIGRDDPKLELAQIVFTITRNTTASGCELRGLRLRDLDLGATPPRVHITREAAKNNARVRTIPLNEEAVAAFRRALARAELLGAHRPEQYLFPFRINRAVYDPNRPASKSWLRSQTSRLRKVTGIKHLRPHAFRHLAVTELLEKGAPEQTVVAIAGWVSRKMIETYSHPRMEAKAGALNLLNARSSAPPTPVPNAGNLIAFPAAATRRF